MDFELCRSCVTEQRCRQSGCAKATRSEIAAQQVLQQLAMRRVESVDDRCGDTTGNCLFTPPVAAAEMRS